MGGNETNSLVKFEYCPILGLKWFEFKEVKKKYLNNFYNKSKYINRKTVKK